ncbi:hypothetical protein [Sphingomonas sp. S-NIH.Pt15_0812]|uniref:hypothetical protein n=1 Tax=Sphingomonas sp. S-NIH.Pt15_0812 TaxID=1920129 RepID=UPI000F7DD368|nr:hypothetical protein [Sphingomonas sp. S-NIH.Pt15_0812]
MAHSHDMPSWHYFLTLERDLAKTTSFVEPHPSNYDAFSDRYAGLLLLIGSEVDVTAKALCNKISPGSTPQNMRDCCNIIMGQYPDLHTVEIDVDQYGLAFKPWES